MRDWPQTLMKSIYLVDCPGTVQPSGNSEAEAVLKGVVRIEQLRQAEEYIEPLLERVRHEYIQRTYGVIEWSDANDFLEKVSSRPAASTPHTLTSLPPHFLRPSPFPPLSSSSRAPLAFSVPPR